MVCRLPLVKGTCAHSFDPRLQIFLTQKSIFDPNFFQDPKIFLDPNFFRLKAEELEAWENIFGQIYCISMVSNLTRRIGVVNSIFVFSQVGKNEYI